MSNHRAIVITDFWAGIIGTLFTACVIGGVAYAWDSNGKSAVLTEKVDKLEDAKLPQRLDKLEEKVDNTNKSLDAMKNDQKDFQTEVKQKLDALLQSKRR